MGRVLHVAFHRIIRMSVASSAVLLATARLQLHAQDPRTVKEPAIPPACLTLKAALTPASATSGEIEARAGKAGSDDPALDTARLQRAIDIATKAAPSNSQSDGADSAFLTGPISLARRHSAHRQGRHPLSPRATQSSSRSRREVAAWLTTAPPTDASR